MWVMTNHTGGLTDWRTDWSFYNSSKSKLFHRKVHRSMTAKSSQDQTFGWRVGLANIRASGGPSPTFPPTFPSPPPSPSPPRPPPYSPFSGPQVQHPSLDSKPICLASFSPPKMAKINVFPWNHFSITPWPFLCPTFYFFLSVFLSFFLSFFLSEEKSYSAENSWGGITCLSLRS